MSSNHSYEYVREIQRALAIIKPYIAGLPDVSHIKIDNIVPLFKCKTRYERLYAESLIADSICLLMDNGYFNKKGGV